MKKINLKSSLLLFLVAFSCIVNAQDISLKVKNGIMYTVDGKWNASIPLHYSKSKFGINYRANIKITSGEHTIEYYLLKDKTVYSIKFSAQPGKKYLICNVKNKPVVKEDNIILTTATIEDVSSKTGENDFQVVPGITDPLQTAILIWDIDNDYFSESKSPIFWLRKVDNYWGDGSTGYISGEYNRIKKEAFKVKLPSGEHTLSARLQLGSTYLLEIIELNYNFEAGKTYTIEFENFGYNEKNLTALQIKMILGSAKIVEIND